ncbi:MAG: cobalamin biosynthesis protein [Desulfovibrionaceae bacterium]|jgi:cobalt-precorrin 5A hydrolase|nr:cobalamin biosynthesis protein [Desulfovibrionaceae bacterium]
MSPNGNGRSTAVYALTRQGAELGKTLARRLGGTLYVSQKLGDFCPNTFHSLPKLVRETFTFYRRHVFVCAAGIVVRAVGPLAASKTVDPAVVVLDQEGRFAVSLLSGHLGGANELARECAAVTGGEAVITTATDTAGIPAIDDLARERGLAVARAARIREISGALLAGRRVQIMDPDGWLGEAVRDETFFIDVEAADAWDAERPGAVVTHLRDGAPRAALLLHPPCLAVGVGCNRGVAGSVILARVRGALERAGLAEPSVAVLASVEAKRDEPGLAEAAGALGARLVFFPAAELARVAVPNPSQAPLEAVGTPSVSEAAALLASGGELIVEKRAADGVTVAVALARGPA